MRYGGRDLKHRSFDYPHAALGVVLEVHEPDEHGMYMCTVRNLDNRANATRVPYFMPYGRYRAPRPQQIVTLHYIEGNPQSATVHGHKINPDPEGSGLSNPAPDSWSFLDDDVTYHPETGAFMRFRNLNSGADPPLADGQPCLFDLMFRSGANIGLSEYALDVPPPPPPPGKPPVKPPPPTRAKMTVVMPSGASLTIDEPQTGQATFELSLPSGVTLSIDENGVVTLTSDDIELGGAGAKLLAWLEDLQQHVDWATSHVHPDPQGGVTGPPQDPPPNPVGTTKTHAL